MGGTFARYRTAFELPTNMWELPAAIVDTMLSATLSSAGQFPANSTRGSCPASVSLSSSALKARARSSASAGHHSTLSGIVKSGRWANSLAVGLNSVAFPYWTTVVTSSQPRASSTRCGTGTDMSMSAEVGSANTGTPASMPRTTPCGTSKPEQSPTTATVPGFFSTPNASASA